MKKIKNKKNIYLEKHLTEIICQAMFYGVKKKHLAME